MFVYTFRLPKGPRAILFKEYLPIMKPLLDELRDIARAKKKTVSQVHVLIFVLYVYVFLKTGMCIYINAMF